MSWQDELKDFTGKCAKDAQELIDDPITGNGGVAITDDRVQLTLPGTEIKVNFFKHKEGGGRLTLTGFTHHDRIITREENGSATAVTIEVASTKA